MLATESVSTRWSNLSNILILEHLLYRSTVHSGEAFVIFLFGTSAQHKAQYRSEMLIALLGVQGQAVESLSS